MRAGRQRTGSCKICEHRIRMIHDSHAGILDLKVTRKASLPFILMLFSSGTMLTGCTDAPRDRSVPWCEQRGLDELGPTYRAQCWDTVDDRPQVAVCPTSWSDSSSDGHRLPSAITPQCVDNHGGSGRGTMVTCPGDADAHCSPL